MSERDRSERFINGYFNRDNAYRVLVESRGVSPEVLSGVVRAGSEVGHQLAKMEELRAERNRLSKALQDSNFRTSLQGIDATERSRLIGEQIKATEVKFRTSKVDFDEQLLSLPNPPSDNVPVGKDEKDNPVVRVAGPMRNYNFEPKPHQTILEGLGLLVDGLSITGKSKFPILIGEAAALEDALRSLFLTHHRNNGRIEINSPHMVNGRALTATGQLPKFGKELYHVHPGGEKDDLYLIPTAEVPLTNLLAGHTVQEEQLPLKIFGYSRCFRVETGSSGQDSQGLKRVHDFGKVEMVDVVKPEKSWDGLESMVSEAERILHTLAIDYRVVILCTGDLPSGSAFTYDIETRIPDSGWREVSSCTNCLDYQARRAGIRCRGNGTVQLVHTLNGSAFPTGRLTAAVIEQYQQKDGSVVIPDGLRQFTNFDTIKAKRFRISSLFS